MITRISSGSSPAGAVFYNEQKVGKGEADRLAIRNFEGIRVAAQSLTPTMVADKLEHRAALNERIKLPTFHVSLALAKGEMVPAQDLLAIADQYMAGMGYGRQPYAVYQHHDTEHPHVHIVSVRVDEIGKKIPDNFERERSNKLRQQIETEFGLQVAEKVGLRPERTELKPVEYGKGDLKADISSVVQGILKDFTFSTFPQFNQLLRIYNVQATEIPLEGQKPGLKYSAIDANGNQLGAAIKASSLAYRPTRETIERRIGAGKKIKGDRISPLRKAADGQLSQSKNWNDFQQRLSRIGVEVIPHLGKDGNLFGISYIDTKQRIVYTGSELGKSFTAGSLKTAFGAFEPKGQAPAMTPHSVDKSQNWSYSEDTLESQMRRDAMAEFNRNNPYVKPTVKQQEEVKEQNKAFGRDQRERDEFKAERSQGKESQDDQNLMPNGDLIRQLLYALGDTSTTQDGEQDLKKMLRRNRKNRLS